MKRWKRGHRCAMNHQTAARELVTWIQPRSAYVCTTGSLGKGERNDQERGYCLGREWVMNSPKTTRI